MCTRKTRFTELRYLVHGGRISVGLGEMSIFHIVQIWVQDTFVLSRYWPYRCITVLLWRTLLFESSIITYIACMIKTQNTS